MSTRWNVHAVALGVILAAIGCNKPSSEQLSGAGSTSDKNGAAATPDVGDNGGTALGSAKANEIFKSRCAACHGNEGRGDGPGAAALNPKPRNYHDKDWQAKVSDEDISKTITYGGAAVGKSPMMPGNPDLDSQPQTVAALVRIVRDFGK